MPVRLFYYADAIPKRFLLSWVAGFFSSDVYRFNTKYETGHEVNRVKTGVRKKKRGYAFAMGRPGYQ